MGIIKVDPFRGFDSVVRRMGDVFDDVQRTGVRFEVGDFTPRVDVSEDDKQLSFAVELPDLGKDDVKITINDGNVLTIRGEKKREEKHEEKNYMRTERTFGSFTRSFLLPDDIDAASINATFSNGVLNVVLAKKEPAQPAEIEVTIQ